MASFRKNSSRKRSRVFSSSEDEEDLENMSKEANYNSIPNAGDVESSANSTTSMNATKVPAFAAPAAPASTRRQPEYETRVLEKTLSGAGLKLDPSPDVSRAHVLDCDQAVFQKSLSKALKQFLNPDDIDTFCSELITLLESNDDVLVKALNPTKTSSSCDTARSTIQDSLVRLLLGVDSVHVKLSTWLLEKLALVSLENETSHDLAMAGPEAAQHKLPQQILSQLRWLDRGVSQENLVEKILEILDASSDSVQHEIIACLPEIVDDKYHTRIAMALRDKLSNNYGYVHRLTNAILDTMSNLSLKHEDTAEIRESVMKKMSVVTIDDLPVIVRFILSSIEPGEELEVISTLRSELDLSPAPAAAMTQLSQQRKARLRRPSRADPRDIDVIVLDTIRISMTGNHKIGDAWFRAIDSSREHKSLDILVLLQLHNLPNRRRPVESLFKNKVRQGLFTGELAERMFQKHATPLRQNFDSLMAVVEALMQSNEPVLSLMATRLHCAMFLNLDRYYQQEIICDLVMKIGAGGSSTLRPTALTTLEMLAFKHTAALCPYSLFTASVLDHIESMSLEEVRRVMDILSRLAFSSHTTSSGLRDDLHIVVRKQISSGKIVLKRMGVVGAVAIVKNMSPSIAHDRSLSASQSTSTSPEMSKSARQARTMLDMAKESTVSVGDVAGLLMDELASLVLMDLLDPDLVAWISSTMTDSFISDYIVDIEDGEKSRDSDFIPLELQLLMKMDEDAPIAVNLGPLVCRNMRGFGGGYQKGSKESTAAMRLIPHFRLLATCVHSENNGDLVSIDALVGCPIWMPKMECIEKFDSLSSAEKNVVCACYFFCINWLLELVNCFSRSRDEEDRKMVLMRIKNILGLEKNLIKILPKNLTFVPAAVLPLVDISSWHPPQNAAPKPQSGGKGGGAKGKGKSTEVKFGKSKGSHLRKRKAVEEDNMSTAAPSHTLIMAPTQAESSQPAEPEESSGTLTNLEHYRPFFREIDMDVFKLLSIGTVKIGPAPTSLDEEMEDPKLRPPELLFLLKDLATKVRHSLVESKTKKGFPGKTNELKNAGFSSLDRMDPKHVANLTIMNLDYLLTHLEEIAEYFKRLIDLNDGIIDGKVVFNDYTPDLVACYETSLLILKTVFAWTGFQASDQRAMLKNGLSRVAGRSNPKLTDKSSLNELIVGAVKHLCLFAKSIINVGCADALLKLIDSIMNCFQLDSDSDSIWKSMNEMAKSFLVTEWRTVDGTVEKGAKFNGHIESILNIYFTTHDRLLEALADYTKDLEEILEKKSGKDCKATRMPTFTKVNLAMHFRVIFAHLNLSTRGLTFGVNKDYLELLDQWELSIPIFFSLVTVPKKMSARILLGSLLKCSRVYLDAFIKHCMPLMDKLFSDHRERCWKLLKEIQMGTRYLQHVCQHSKTIKDVSLSNHVPALKKSLETFLFRVKVTLAVNNIQGAFWMGVLKNRNLDGKEIQTQAAENSDDESKVQEDEEEEENGEEEEVQDDQSDVELDGEGESSSRHEDDGDNGANITML